MHYFETNLKKNYGAGHFPSPDLSPGADCPVFRLDQGFSVMEKNTPRFAIRIYLHC